MPAHGRKQSTAAKRNSPPIVLPKLNPNAAGIDIGTEEIWVAVPPDRSAQSVRMFLSFTKDLREMTKWLKECGVNTVAMESTGVLWIPLFQILSDAEIEVLLVNARQYQNVPGRRTDVQDCQWLQYLHSVGLVRSSFLPEQRVRALRGLVRHRENLTRMAAKHTQHIQKALDLMNLKPHYVISDIMGATGLRILDAIVEGKRDPEELAKLRDRRIKATAEQVKNSLVGDYRPEHLFTLMQSLEIWRNYQKWIENVDKEIELYIAQVSPEAPTPRVEEAAPKRLRSPKKIAEEKLRAQCHRAFGVDLTRIPGIGPATARVALSEIGPDFGNIPSAGAFASLIGLCPNHEITGGKVVSRKTKKTTNRLAASLRMAAESLLWDKSSLGDWFRRIRPRMDPAAANTTAAHKLARILFALVTRKQEYDERRFAEDHQPDMRRKKARLQKAALAMGFQLIPIQGAAEVVP